MILIWIVQFRLSDGKVMTFRDQSIGNSVEEIKTVLDKVFYDFEVRERATIIGFEYIIRHAN